MNAYTITEKVIFRLIDKDIEENIKKMTAKADKLLFGSKSHDYNSGEVGMEDMFPCGFYSAYTFIYQKLMRLKSLYEADGDPKHESVEDNWIDLLNYVRMSYAVIKFLEVEDNAKEEKEKEK